MAKKALVAMSGGVDSSVAAYLTKEAGYETSGATMQLFRSNGDWLNSRDIEDARSVASSMGIKHCVFDFSEDFREDVIDRFIRSYEAGQTPNPCVDCNRNIKFHRLFREGRKMSQDMIVTGHYARVERDPGSGRYLLLKAVDDNKDQSYVLYNLSQDQLAHTLFPLGNMSKPEARAIAEEQHFVSADKHESQDICFIPDGDYAGFIRRYTGRDYPPGNFVDRNGNILGQHLGIIKYTIGQRKGLGLALKHPMYVCAIDTARNEVILGDNEDLFRTELEADHVNWTAQDAPSGDMKVSAKIRYKHKEAPATVIPLAEDKIKVIFDEPQRAVTAGQSVVLYDGNIVIGGGTII